MFNGYFYNENKLKTFVLKFLLYRYNFTNYQRNSRSILITHAKHKNEPLTNVKDNLCNIYTNNVKRYPMNISWLSF